MKTVIKKRGGAEFSCSVTSICNYSDLVKVEVQKVGSIENALTTCSKKQSRKETRNLIKTILHQ